MFGVVVLMTSSLYLKNILMALLSKKVIFDLRNSIYNNLLHLPIKYFKDNNSGIIIQKILDDVKNIEGFINSGMINFISHFLIITGSIVIIINMNIKLATAALVIGIVIFLFINMTANLIKKLARKIQMKLGDITSLVQQGIIGIEVIKSFTSEKRNFKKFYEEHENYLFNNKKEIKVGNLQRPIIDLVGAIGVILILGIGAILIFHKEMTNLN